MELYRGTDRYVLVGKKVTVKIARSHPIGFLSYATQVKNRFGLGSIIDRWNYEKADSFTKGMKWRLLHGIVANRREVRLANTFDVVTPTKGVLFGLVNIQPTTRDLPATEDDISSAFRESFTNEGQSIPRIGHLLEEPANLGIYKGAVQFRDGGERGLDQILTIYDGADEIRSALGLLTKKYCQIEPTILKT